LGALARPTEWEPSYWARLLDTFEQRLNGLEAAGAPDVAAALRKQLIELIEPLVDEDPGLARTQHGLMSRVIESRRTIAFADIETRCREYRERQAARQVVGPVLEWQMWAMLRATADRLMILDPGSLPSLFGTVYVRVCNFAVYQVNVLKNAPLAEDMFSWLYRLTRPGSDEAQLMARNIRATGGHPRR
jgi:hypothetical protein